MKHLPGNEPQPKKKKDHCERKKINLLDGKSWKALIRCCRILQESVRSHRCTQQHHFFCGPVPLQKHLSVLCWTWLNAKHCMRHREEEKQSQHIVKTVHSHSSDIPPFLFVFLQFFSPLGSLCWAGIIRDLVFSWYFHHAGAVREPVFLLFQSNKWLTET